MKKHWTFLYVPEDEGGVRTLHLSKRKVGLLAGLCAAGLVLSLLLAVGFVRQGIVLHDSAGRERQIRSLTEKLSDLEKKVASYEVQVDENYQLLERANLLAGLGPLDRTVREVGVGGYEPVADPLTAPLQPLARRRVEELDDQLDKMLRQARFQKESYEQVLATLREDQLARDTTPSIRPIREGWLSSRYGRRKDPFTGQPAFHRGVDFSAPVGTPVHATAAGEVVRAARRGRFGLMVEVEHGNGTVTRYGHLNGFAVEKGDVVERGEVVGYVGNSGRSTGPHVHYEVVKDGRSQNPFLYIIRD